MTDPRPTVELDAALDELCHEQRVQAMSHARMVEILDRVLQGPERAELWRREVVAEIALALRMPERSVESLAGEAHALVRSLPATLEALREGRITVRHARIMVDEAAGMGEEFRSLWEVRALKSVHLSTGAFKRTVKRLRERLDPATAAARHEAAKRHGLNVWVDAGSDGLAYLTACLPVAQAQAAFARIDDFARAVQAADPEMTLGAARVDVAAGLLLGSTVGSGPLGAVRTEVVVTIPAATLLGGQTPAEVEGLGPIDAETARTLAAGATVFRRMLTDPFTGIRLTLGRETYKPTAEQRRWLRLRDRSCRWPGCNRRVGAADLDHLTAWAEHGPTDTDNLAHLCRRHHTLKHQSAWKVHGDPNHTMVFVSPTGRHYDSPVPTDPDPPWALDAALATLLHQLEAAPAVP